MISTKSMCSAAFARDIIEKLELSVYTDDFGSRKGDNCLMADFGGKEVGAVWKRR